MRFIRQRELAVSAGSRSDDMCVCRGHERNVGLKRARVPTGGLVRSIIDHVIGSRNIFSEVHLAQLFGDVPVV